MKLKSSLVRVAGVLVACVFASMSFAQEGAADPAVENETSIESFAWIAGHWKAEALGGICEETWNPPLGNSMMGMFRLVENEKVKFYEILTIVPNEDSWLLRLKHFDTNLVGWEEKDKSVEFPLISVSPTEAIFDGLKFLKIDDTTMHVIVRVEQGAKTDELKFVFKLSGSEG